MLRKKPGTMKCENCETGTMEAFAKDSYYWYYACKNKKCRKERLVPIKEAPKGEGE